MAVNLKEHNHELEAQQNLTLRPGEQLKEERLKQKLSITQVSESLRISERYIVALEDHDTKVLPEQVYTLGFVRAYAIFLGLSQERLIAEFKELTNCNANVLDFPMPEKTSSAPRALIITVSVIIMALVYALWVHSDGEDKVDVLAKMDVPKSTKELDTPVIDEITKTPQEDGVLSGQPVADPLGKD